MDVRGERLVTQPGQNQVYVPVRETDPCSKRLSGNVNIDHTDMNVIRSLVAIGR
jgi:hypothetical protein